MLKTHWLVETRQHCHNPVFSTSTLLTHLGSDRGVIKCQHQFSSNVSCSCHPDCQHFGNI